MTDIQVVVRDTILRAIQGENLCRIYATGKGVSIYNYQDRLGINTVLELYTGTNFSSDDFDMGLRWKYAPYFKNESFVNEFSYDGGSLFIKWAAVEHVSISSSSDRILIKLDNVVINFLSPIKQTDEKQKD